MVAIEPVKHVKNMRKHEKYDEIMLYIEETMSDPGGSEEDQIRHTELMSKAEIDAEAKEYVKETMRRHIRAVYKFKEDDLYTLVEQMYGDIYGLGILQHLDDKEGVAEIFIDAEEWPEFRCMVHLKENGKPQYRYDGPVYETLDQLRSAFDNMLRFTSQQINAYDNASIEATRPNGDRIQISAPKDSSSWWMRIRKFNNFVPTIDNMIKAGTTTREMADLVRVFMRSYDVNVVVMGALGTAKTSTMNGFLSEDPIDKGIVAIVEVDEMNRTLLGNHLLTVLNIDEKRERTFEEHLATALRSSAHRIIVPESRGRGFPTLIRTINQIRGGMFTIHAADADGGMYVMTDMYRGGIDSQGETEESIQAKIVQSVNVAIVMRRIGNTIRMWEITEYLQDDRGRYMGTNQLFRFKQDPENPTEGHYERTGNRISDRLRQRLNENGIPMSELERW